MRPFQVVKTTRVEIVTSSLEYEGDVYVMIHNQTEHGPLGRRIIPRDIFDVRGIDPQPGEIYSIQVMPLIMDVVKVDQ